MTALSGTGQFMNDLRKASRTEPDADQTAYDAVPYPVWSHPNSHPNVLAAIARLHGMSPASVGSCRVLELGCARGGNLIPMADQLPGSQFVGVDLSTRQIDEARETVARLGLSNIDLHAVDLKDVDASFGEFDFIICHGVYSWVDCDVQNRILGIIAEHLTPNGVAFVSYNTFPGWRMRQIVREMMCFHGRKFQSPADQVKQARALVSFAADFTSSSNTPYGQMLKNEVDQLPQSDDSYLLHEFFEEKNRPLYFHEFAQQAADANLQYVSEADLSTAWLRSIDPASRQTLNRISADRIEQEQYMDFLINRQFRQTLLCRSDIALNQKPATQTIRSLHVTANLRPQTQVDCRSEEVQSFDTGTGQLVGTAEPVTKAAFQELSEAWPASVPFDELFRRAEIRLGCSLSEDKRETLANDVLRSSTALFARLTASDCGCATTLPEKPVASRYARLRAESSLQVTNLQHVPVNLSERHARLLSLLDGSRDVSQQAAAMEHNSEQPTAEEVQQWLKELVKAGLIYSEENMD